jgi:protease IV
LWSKYETGTTMEETTDDTLMSEPVAASETAVNPPSQPTVIHVKPEANNRQPLWILASVTIGFLLPVCACAIFFFASVTSLSLASLSGLGDDVGVGDAVAIVRVEGPILSGDEPDLISGSSVSGRVIQNLKAAAEDDDVKAIVLRIDSPGGSVTGSAQIYEAVKALDKPVVASMAATAASGGYYISAPADFIMARPDTVTGSIGVIVTLFNAQELLQELGVEVITIASGDNKALGSLWEELTPEQRVILEEFVDEAYTEFVRIIVEGRDMSEREVLTLADGRIYTGRQALTKGLVDDLGDFDEAVAKAAELGSIVGEPRLIEYETTPTIWQIVGGLSSQLTKSDSDRVWEVFDTFSRPQIEYRYVGPR